MLLLIYYIAASAKLSSARTDCIVIEAPCLNSLREVLSLLHVDLSLKLSLLLLLYHLMIDFSCLLFRLGHPIFDLFDCFCLSFRSRFRCRVLLLKLRKLVMLKIFRGEWLT